MKKDSDPGVHIWSVIEKKPEVDNLVLLYL
jgi:hypothetical protein